MLKQVKVLGIAMVMGLGLNMVGCDDVEDTNMVNENTTKQEEILTADESANYEPFDEEAEENESRDMYTNGDVQVKEEIRYRELLAATVKAQGIVLNDWQEEFKNSNMSIEDFAAMKATKVCEAVHQELIIDDNNFYEVDKEGIFNVAGKETVNLIIEVYNEELKEDENIVFERDEDNTQQEIESEENQYTVDDAYNAMTQYATEQFGTAYIFKEGIEGNNEIGFSGRIYYDQECEECIAFIVIDGNLDLVSIELNN